LILAVDTTTRRGSIALLDAGEPIAELRFESEASHSQRVMPGIAFLMQSLELRAEDIDGYAVALGPGSFTGLRVGIATVQGLALARGTPCFGASTLDILAHRVRGAAETLVTAMDAHRGELYVGVYGRDAEAREPPRVISPDQLRTAWVSSGGAPALFGDGVERHRAALRKSYPEALFPERSLFLAGTLGRMAAPILAEGGGCGPTDLAPVYVRAPTISRAAKPAS
jgi:tRNA threonylcarbamoyladenosine biosynthesis protein TsaB